MVALFFVVLLDDVSCHKRQIVIFHSVLQQMAQQPLRHTKTLHTVQYGL